MLNKTKLEFLMDQTGVAETENTRIPALTTAAISQLLSPEKQLDLLSHLEHLGERRETSIQQKLRKLNKKYFDLVWAARNDGDGAQPLLDEITAKYPEEWKLYLEDDTNWVHGFNSGCLAVVRLLQSYALPFSHREVLVDDEDSFVLTRDTEIEQAEDEFPMLDT